MESVNISPVIFKAEHEGLTVFFEIKGKRVNINRADKGIDFVFQGSTPKMVNDIGHILQEIAKWADEEIEKKEILKD
jgi:hypothetical protein